MKNWKTLVVEVKRQIESVVEEKGWREHEQLNQESSKGGGRFRNSPINLMEAPKNTKDDKKEKESPELKEELTEEESKSVDWGGFTSTPPGFDGPWPHCNDIKKEEE